MKVITRMEEFPRDRDFVAVGLGNFDGIHIGHQTIIKQLVQKARDEKGISVVFSFNPHPLQVLKKDGVPYLLSKVEDKIRLVEKLEADYFVLFPFSRETAEMSPDDFVDQVLIQGLGAKSIFVGYNFTFGKGAEGNAEMLQKICRGKNCAVIIVPEVKFNDDSVSSTNIRKYLSRGKIRHANKLLGYAYNLAGIVVPGDQRGRQLGFPTANLKTDPEMVIPANGVYAVKVLTDCGLHKGVANIGIRPTFGHGLPQTVEIHLMENSMDLYGQRVRVFFVEYLRGEKRFPNVGALVEQIKADIEKAEEILLHNGTGF